MENIIISFKVITSALLISGIPAKITGMFLLWAIPITLQIVL
ncbi:hypothetical protein SAMN05661012_04700 [Chitinophaga sancti]|uniref:Uncharacterized protein n=1 Tax=Chitinophaga sancti TaxID=1004 RepID=A0A1K1S3P3_9BACT|nr:hypothetical protein SAMN05661012_04700 [Chitinophaga sancti]